MRSSYLKGKTIFNNFYFSNCQIRDLGIIIRIKNGITMIKTIIEIKDKNNKVIIITNKITNVK